MREILFRAKCKNDGKWMEGFPVRVYDYGGKVWEMHPFETNFNVICGVIPETICQFTGLTDKNGKKIFDGDIIEWFAQGESEHPDFGYIEYDEQSFTWRVCWQKYDPDFMEGMQQEYISVIGNIHDNPELL